MTSEQLDLAVVGTGDKRRLRVSGPSAQAVRAFEGDASEGAGGTVLDGPLSAANAEAVRVHVPSLRPQPLGLRLSAGVGDRLGLATPGHVRAFRNAGAGITPVFAQQSHREMDRLGRTPQQVLDDATFGCLQAGWDGVVGSDADHLKTIREVDNCLAAGFTSFTLDPGDHVRHVDGDATQQQLDDVPWGELEDDIASMMQRYAGFSLDLGDSRLAISEDDIRRAAAKYGAAVAHTVAMYRRLMDAAGHPVEVEVSVDETDDVTTLAEHVYLATEMQRLEMSWVSFAPRYIGRFEKGVDYIGDRDELYTSLVQHSRIAQAFGPYKISLHSGSDKYSIYELAAEATGRVMHLKTSGTSYLVAVETAARFAPALFREIYALSREAFRGARSSYHVSAQIERTPEPTALRDEDMMDLVTGFDGRQILHVGYGAVLRTADETGPSKTSVLLRELLGVHSAAYEDALEAHLARHLAPFAEQAS